MQHLIYAWRTLMMWRRERVGRTLTAVEAGAKKERACGVDPTVVREAVGEVPVWTRRWSVRRDIEVDAEEEQTCDVDLAAVGEVIDVDPTAMETVEERAGGSEMIPPGLGFKGQPCS
jgi:hypothetical protein